MSRSCLVILLCPLLFLISCSKHYSLQQPYTFKSATGAPDYGQLDYWAAHPWKWDPSDSVPKPLRKAVKDSTVDVFFLHPTTLTSKKSDEINARIDDAKLNKKTDYSTILYQASVFNEDCRVFSPRYRQAHIRNFFLPDTAVSNAAFELAYTDVKNAFVYYLEHFNNGRPIIIASHSQGSRLALRLLKEFFEDKILYNKLVVAYIAGWPVPKEYFTTLRICTDSLQTGCVCSWRTFRKGYVPSFLENEHGNSYVTNPLNWNSDETYATKQLNKGSVLAKFNKVYKHTTDAQIGNGFLYVKKPVFPWSFLYFTKNYHIGDINLFYLNIRENVKKRIGLFWKH
jgi:hypothetical protein